ncbi:MAG: hypothetical protein M4579_005019 [Chaenotheca gracillima]|nr:MAG: hypothetical protein M4579_005019 [Chaenotheca gracillima]
MRTATIAAAVSALMVSMTAAAPSGHKHLHQKREPALVSSTLTIYENVVKTVTDLTIVTLTPGEQPSPAENTVAALPTLPPASTSAAPAPPSSAPAPPPKAAEPQPEPQAAPPASSPTTTSSSTSTTPTPTPTTPAYTPPATTSAAPAPPASSSPPASGGGGSTGGACSKDSPCSGDITYYEPGLGACGWTNSSDEPIVALPHGLMGEQSNGNPFCGRHIQINNNGKTATAKVVDKCMGCEGDSIDLSDSVFKQLASMDAGRVSDVDWYFTD